MTGCTPEEMIRMHIIMPSDIAQAALTRANAAGISRSELVRILLTEYLENS
jgi:Ribbon-helix-helix protein, copG family